MDELIEQSAVYDARVVVIGAGQAGLSVGYRLLRRGLRPGRELVILDRGPSAGGAWQFRWPALRLGTAHHVHDLPGMHEMGLRFADADTTRPARDVVADYYRRFEDHYGLEVWRPVRVDDVARAADRRGLVVHGVASGVRTMTVHAEVVVNASGTWGAPFVPWYPGRDRFRGVQIDTTGYRSAAAFAGQDVVVVGGGTSAIGFLLELDGVARSTRWFTRRPVEWLQASKLEGGAAVTAVAVQDRAARAGQPLPSIVSGTGVPISARIRDGLDRGVLHDERMFERVLEDGVRLRGGEDVHADAIIWATGFRPDIRHLSGLRLRTEAGGIAVADGQSVEEPRLFLAGYGPQASTVGVNRASRETADRIMAVLDGATQRRS